MSTSSTDPNRCSIQTGTSGHVAIHRGNTAKCRVHGTHALWPCLVLAITGLVVGCADSTTTAPAELSVGMPVGGSDPGSLTEGNIAAPTLSDVRGEAMDAKFASYDAARISRQNFDANLRRLRQAIAPPSLATDEEQLIQLVQQGTPRGVEIVPTPQPTLVKPELIPTPKGVPDKKGGTPDPALGPEDYTTWDDPIVTLVISGQQHGYLEPCGCTGLDKQKGGVARRMTFMKQLRARGWELLPIDAGNQVRRIGRQAAIKFSWTAEALKQMKYEAVGFGPDDLRLSAIDLIQVAAADDPNTAMYLSANVVLIDPSFVPTYKVVERGEIKIGVTTILDPDAINGPQNADVTIQPTVEAAKQVLKEMNAEGATFRVLSFFGTEDKAEEAAKALMLAVPGFDLIIVGGGYGEPTYKPQDIEGSKTKLIVTGSKAMYAGLVALYDDGEMKYVRVPLTHEFQDAPEMRQLMANYQEQLKSDGLEGLGVSPIPHSSGQKYVGTEACGKCHTKAMDVWSGSAHVDATADIVKPPKERGDVARHFDPECLSCHVTGWNPQRYYPYESGYLSLDMSHLHGNGCENCHGPGSLHAAAEQEGSAVPEDERNKLRLAMQLPLDKAREHCMQCHDLDNSPDFHEADAFEDNYWPEIEHYGKD